MKLLTSATAKMASPVVASIIAVLLVSIFPETKAIICPAILAGVAG